MHKILYKNREDIEDTRCSEQYSYYPLLNENKK